MKENYFFGSRTTTIFSVTIIPFINFQQYNEFFFLASFPARSSILKQMKCNTSDFTLLRRRKEKRRAKLIKTKINFKRENLVKETKTGI